MDRAGSFVVIANNCDQVVNYGSEDEHKNRHGYHANVGSVIFGPFNTRKTAVDWANEWVLGNFSVSEIIDPKNVVHWETTEPKYKCNSCGQELNVEDSCRCTG